jgi:DNA adenine methylase
MESPEFITVSPVRPPAPYVGGKRSLAKQIIQRINAVPHEAYAEPFVGMGGVFFRRDRRPECEVINDLSADVATLFRILQRHYQSFLEELKWRLSSRAEFDRLMRQDPDTLTDLERAARFLYLQRLAFGGSVSGRSFAMAKSRPARFDLTKLVPMLEEVHERLAGVTIERLPYADFIAKYDRAGMLFFIDPPYWGTEGYYGAGMFDPGDFARLADQLAKLRGRFIMTINDRAETREMFARFNIAPASLFYRLSGKPTAASELIISN